MEIASYTIMHLGFPDSPINFPLSFEGSLDMTRLIQTSISATVIFTTLENM